VKPGFLLVLLVPAAMLVSVLSGKFAGVVFFVAAAYVFSVVGKARATLTGYAALAENGIPARGILLQVSPTVMSVQGGQVKTRMIRVDVEMPGRAPFEVHAPIMMPFNLSADVVPGATMELRLDPKDQTKIAIVGPGVGFIGGQTGTGGSA
jgi:hypothetical protein